MSGQQLTYAEVAARIEAVLGERPSLTTLRDAASRAATLPNPRNRVTAGMPRPTPGPPGSPSLFDAAEVDAWLASHPRRTWSDLRAAIADAKPEERAAAVASARAAGISWQTVADVINAADGTDFTRQWAQQKYGRSGA